MPMNLIRGKMRFHLRKSVVAFSQKIIRVNETFIA